MRCPYCRKTVVGEKQVKIIAGEAGELLVIHRSTDLTLENTAMCSTIL